MNSMFGKYGPAIWAMGLIDAIIDCIWKPGLRPVFMPIGIILFVALALWALEHVKQWRVRHEEFLDELERDLS